MRYRTWLPGLVAGVWLSGAAASAAEYPAPREAYWVAPDFHFHTGETLPALRQHYLTIGNPAGEPVVILHGTAGSGASMLTPEFAGELFGRGQPLDAARYFIILPDSLGAGKSAKPSDGLRAKFPDYDYDDMVSAQYRLVHEGLGLRHVRLVLGNSMGGMNAWLWGEHYPDFMDALVPMASQPTAMSARNWMMRRLLVDSIRRDPDWHNGDYTTQPRAFALANVMFGVATSGGTLGYQSLAPTRALADKQVDARLAAPFTADANDFMYQWNASGDFDASAGLGRIRAAVLAINSADDERNPPQTGLMVQAMRRIPSGQLYVIPASAETRGHGTTGMARFWKTRLQTFLAHVPVGHTGGQ